MEKSVMKFERRLSCCRSVQEIFEGCLANIMYSNRRKL